jgi:Flp pilus assembly pilin Flp
MSTVKPERNALAARLDSVVWGLLFFLVAALAIPRGTTEYAVLAGLGAAMVLVNLVRVGTGIGPTWFSSILGASLLAGGVAALGGVHMDVVVLFFLFAGVVTVATALLRPIGTRQPA